MSKIDLTKPIEYNWQMREWCPTRVIDTNLKGQDNFVCLAVDVGHKENLTWFENDGSDRSCFIRNKKEKKKRYVALWEYTNKGREDRTEVLISDSRTSHPYEIGEVYGPGSYHERTVVAAWEYEYEV